MKTNFTIILLSVFLFACGKKSPLNLSENEVRISIPGTYIGNYYNGKERFEISTNGNFSQVFIQSGREIYSSKGSWVLKKAKNHHVIEFAPFMDFTLAISNGEKPKQIMGSVGDFYIGEPRIYFFRDIDYFITKIK